MTRTGTSLSPRGGGGSADRGRTPLDDAANIVPSRYDESSATPCGATIVGPPRLCTGKKDPRATPKYRRLIHRLSVRRELLAIRVRAPGRATYARQSFGEQAQKNQGVAVGGRGKAYRAYLRSKPWQAKRGSVFKGNPTRTCYVCGVPNEARDVHHKHYLNFGGEETNQDLVAVCRPCHDRIHATSKSKGISIALAGRRLRGRRIGLSYRDRQVKR